MNLLQFLLCSSGLAPQVEARGHGRLTTPVGGIALNEASTSCPALVLHVSAAATTKLAGVTRDSELCDVF